MEDKRKKYLKIFRTEAEEYLSVINRGLVVVEQGKAGDELINDILRASHTLKGSSRMLGLEEIGAIAHKMEDIMKAVESGELKPSPEVVDRMLESADAISRLLNIEEDQGEVEVELIVARLTEIMETGGKPAEDLTEPEHQPEEPTKPPTPKTGKKTKKQKGKNEKAAAERAGRHEVVSTELEPASADKKRPEPADHAPSATESKTVIADTLRVQASRLDRLIDYAGELLIGKIKLESRTFSAKNILVELTELVSNIDVMISNGAREQVIAKLQAVRNECHEFVQEFIEDVIELDVNVNEMQHSALQLRMTPASTLFDEFPRLVRDLAREMGKEIRLEIKGEDTELDKRLLEQLRGPLIHIIRNCCDHGIETPEERMAGGKSARGSLVVQAYHQGSSVVVDVMDDGKGMDVDRIKEVAITRGVIDKAAARELSDEEAYYLALRPGFSTSRIITDISGRGVGLDVVKTNVESLRGDLKIKSSRGAGTTVELRLPLTVSIIEALLVLQGGEVYAVPLTAVEEVTRIKVSDLVMDRGKEALSIRGRLLPLIRLGDLLRLTPLEGEQRELRSPDDMLNVVILKFRNQHLALEVDKAMRDQEILVKSLGRSLKRAPLVSGATILRKGEPALILNVFDIFSEAEQVDGKSIKEMVAARENESRLPLIMVVDDSITTRTIEKNILERAGYKVIAAVSGEDALTRIERVDDTIDLFVVDIDMPGINGFELTEKIRALSRTKNKPVIILTSRASDEDKRRGIAVGAQAYIVKGAFDQNVLLDTVQSLIGD